MAALNNLKYQKYGFSFKYSVPDGVGNPETKTKSINYVNAGTDSTLTSAQLVSLCRAMVNVNPSGSYVASYFNAQAPLDTQA